MNNLFLSGLIIFSTGAYALTGDDMFYMVEGNKASAEQAIVASMQNKAVFKCTPQEFKVSKSGTSIGVRNVKKKLTAEDAAKKIEEIEKQRDSQ